MSHDSVDRRGFIKKTLLSTAGATIGMQSFEEKHLLAESASTKARDAHKQLNDRQRAQAGQMTYGKIKDLKVSRLFCGGNLIGGWAHSRDLIYVSPLVKAYHTDEKVFETLEIAEEMGINTILTNPRSDTVINRYWKEIGGEIQWFSDCAWGSNLKEGIKRSVDSGAHSVYLQGGIADQMVRDGKIDELGESLAYIKELGVPGGLGAHELETVKACVEAGFDPDYWVKTLHADDYWSATPEENRQPFDVVGPRTKDHDGYNDNMYCRDAKGTIDFMNSIEKPWIAFKVMAAGAIHPRQAFKFAFEGGADFICAGMFDFQVREDVLISNKILSGTLARDRPWRA